MFIVVLSILLGVVSDDWLPIDVTQVANPTIGCQFQDLFGKGYPFNELLRMCVGQGPF